MLPVFFLSPKRPIRRLTRMIHPSASLILVTLALAACEDRSQLPEYDLTGATMGTQFSVTLVAPPKDLDKDSLKAHIEEMLAALERRMSAYIVDSEISTFNDSRSTDWFSVSRELCELVDEALAISRLMGGAFDVTAGPLVNLWGFGPDGVRSKPPSAADIATARARVGYDKLHADCSIPALRKRNPDIYVDLSAYAKGYAVDRIADLLESKRVDNFLVDVGGELRMRGLNAQAARWAVAVEKPSATGRAVQNDFRFTDTGMATSGDYRNYFDHAGKRYSHVIDTRFGAPVSHELASVTVVSESTAVADAMATALFVLGPDEGFERARHDDIAAYFLVRSESGLDERMTSAFESKTYR